MSAGLHATVFAFTKAGQALALHIQSALSAQLQAELVCGARISAPGFSPLNGALEDEVGARWTDRDALIFIGAAGIAVRAVAPHVKDKTTDPAVLVVDTAGQFVISLLSGHIGGANRLCAQLAQAIHATPVITTATDTLRRFSADAWAKAQGYAIDDMRMAKAVSAAILEGDIGFCAHAPIRGTLPAGLAELPDADIGILVSPRIQAPFARTLRLIPPVLHLGLGCRRGASKEAVLAAVSAVLSAHDLDIRAVKSAASIVLKQDEEGLLLAMEALNIPLAFYTAEQLNALPGPFAPSPFVKSVTGVDNVSERAAAMGGHRILVNKTKRDGVTVAVGEQNWEVSF